jgi:hypothetical protein
MGNYGYKTPCSGLFRGEFGYTLASKNIEIQLKCSRQTVLQATAAWSGTQIQEIK